jgi:hypothetical protein
MAPRGCGHLPCLAGELSSRASSDSETRGEWDSSRRYRQLLDCSNQHVLLPSDQYADPEITDRFSVDPTNLYAKVRPKARRPRPHLGEAHHHHQQQQAPPPAAPPLPSIPEAGPPPGPQQTARLARLRREMESRPRPPARPLRLPPVCGRSPPCHCPEDRELATRLRLRVLRRIGGLRRKHLRLRVRPAGGNAGQCSVLGSAVCWAECSVLGSVQCAGQSAGQCSGMACWAGPDMRGLGIRPGSPLRVASLLSDRARRHCTACGMHDCTAPEGVYTCLSGPTMISDPIKTFLR